MDEGSQSSRISRNIPHFTVCDPHTGFGLLGMQNVPCFAHIHVAPCYLQQTWNTEFDSEKNIRRSHTTLCTVHVCAKRCVFMSNIFKNRTLKKNKNLQRKYCSSSESVVWLRRHYYCVHSVHPCTCIVYSIKATTVVTLLRFQAFINYWPSFFRSGPVFRHHCKQLCNRILCHTVLRLSFLFGVLGFFKQLLVHLSVVHVWQ